MMLELATLESTVSSPVRARGLMAGLASILVGLTLSLLAVLFRAKRLEYVGCSVGADTREKERDLGIVNTVVLLETTELGEGLLLLLPLGLEPGVPSRECLKEDDLKRQGSGSRVGMPVAEVVVVHVLVDMRRISDGGKLRRRR